ncbi:DUF1217 domain-containing protein [Oleisolibacter albus]|uniref:DUF1217 domain-containing protein n=1 Tax=Oleisolibacter albus TaxID=2171757 RepID=UPI000DF1F50B|nr:DUF1217 domain-containing protein [Oleisolibacter albus]
MLEGIGSLAAYNVIQRQGAELTQKFTSSKLVQKDLTDFQTRMAKITTPEELLKDRKALEFVLSSYQLDSESWKTGLLKKLMTEDPNDSKSMAARLADPRFAQFAKDFSNWTTQPSKNAELMTKVMNNAMTVRFEREQGDGNPGLQEALYFLRNIKSVETVPQLMADKALLYVTRIGLGMPDSYTQLPFDSQLKLMKERVDLDKLKDPDEQQKFVKRFLISVGGDQASGSVNSAASAALTILGGGGGSLTSLLGQKINLHV